MTYLELILLLKTAKSKEEIEIYQEDIAQWIPQVRRMFGFDQKNQTHQYDLWRHSLQVVVELPRNGEDDMLYLAALLHDIGKPDCQVAGKRADDTNMHYYGHSEKSKQIVQREVLPTLYKKGVRISSVDQKRLLYYVYYHDEMVSLKMKSIRRHMKMVTLEEFKKLMLLQIADAKAHILLPMIENRLRICETLYGGLADKWYEKLIEEEKLGETIDSK